MILAYMEAIQIILMVAFGFAGLFTLLLGYLISQNQLTEVIAMPSFAVSKIKDKAIFSRFAAKRVYLIGWFTLLTAAIIALLPQFIMISAVSFNLAVVIICIEFMVSSRKHLSAS